jgi:PAS domain S-box-containing protein
MSTIPLSPEFLRGVQEVEATYRHLVEGTPAILYIDAVDEPSTNLYTSPQIEEMLGYSVEEWRRDAELWIARMHDDDRDRVLAEHRESNRTGHAFHAEYRLFAREGAERWFRDEAVIVRNDEGEPLFWRGVMLDITGRSGPSRSCGTASRCSAGRWRSAASCSSGWRRHRRRSAGASPPASTTSRSRC